MVFAGLDFLRELDDFFAALLDFFPGLDVFLRELTALRLRATFLAAILPLSLRSGSNRCLPNLAPPQTN